MTLHKLKTWPTFFAAVERGIKTFEVRKNDRNFQVGDTLLLEEWNPETRSYTGFGLLRTVSYITDGKALDCKDKDVLKEGYVIMGLV